MEIRDIRNKYIDDSLFNGFRNELDNYKIQLGNNITNSLKTKQGWTESLNTQVWDKGIGQYNKIINDIDNLRNNIEISKQQILSCTTLEIADKSYEGIKDVIRIFKSRWQNEEQKLIKDWTSELLSLIQQAEVNNPTQPTIPPTPTSNLQLEQALQRIWELEQTLLQVREENQEKDNVINGLRDNLDTKDNIIENKNNKIEEQVINIEVKNNKIIELQGKLLEKTEQITVETNKYNAEHNKLVDTKYKINVVKLKLDNFINNHNVEDQDKLVEMLGDLQIVENQ